MPSLQNRQIDYSNTEVKTTQYEYIDDRGLPTVTRAGLYCDCIINSSFVNRYCFDNKKESLLASLTLIWTEKSSGNQYKIPVSFNLSTYAGMDRITELSTLLNLTNDDGTPNGYHFESFTSKAGQDYMKLAEVQGKHIDVVIDNLRKNEKGYIKCLVRGFFKDGISAGEKSHNTPLDQLRDVQVCVANVKQLDAFIDQPQMPQLQPQQQVQQPMMQPVQQQPVYAQPQQMQQMPRQQYAQKPNQRIVQAQQNYIQSAVQQGNQYAQQQAQLPPRGPQMVSGLAQGSQEEDVPF